MSTSNKWTIFDLLGTGSCLLCDTPLPRRSQALCPDCYQDLPRLHHACYGCGLPLQQAPASSLCGRCLRHSRVVHHTHTLFHYRPPLDRLILAAKFSRGLAQAKFLGDLLARQPATELPEAFLPMPLHPSRQRQRGYNQALEMARSFHHWQRPILNTQVIRQRPTLAQSDLNAPQRRRNVRGAFAVVSALKFNHIAIVDDVVTTGSTVNELARCLLRHGVQRVDVWACARAHR